MNNVQDDNGGSKKAVHVKWAGKTIALGTFPSAEADEKCARAKALTRAWRSTMRPKPTREWVMNELERLGVRIVSGKLGRKSEEDEEGARGIIVSNGSFSMSGNMDMASAQQERLGQQRRDSNGGIGSSGMGGGGGGGSLGGIPSAASSQQVNQHYEMLKLHHMNLLQELHETTMMMNMYQQQQLQQEQLKLQQRGDQLGGMMGPKQGSLGAMDSLYASQRGSLGLGIGPRGSLGLGVGLGGGFGHRGSLDFGGGMDALLRHENDNMGGRRRHADDQGDGHMKRQKTSSDDSDEDD